MNQQPMISARKPVGSLNRHEEHAQSTRNRMVLCLGGWPRAAVLERYFQERGWKVYIADSGDSARRFVRKHGPSVVLLADECTDHESGWLTSWKLLHEKPGSKVVLVGNLPVEKGKRFVKIVGATDYLPSSETAVGLASMLQEADIC
jgi:ActR/RegA family two-component response regulator